MIEKFLHALMTQAGLSPEHIMRAYQTVMRWQAEIEAFKTGAGGVVQDFRIRLDAIESEMRVQRALLHDMHALLAHIIPLTDGDHAHVRADCAAGEPGSRD